MHVYTRATRDGSVIRLDIAPELNKLFDVEGPILVEVQRVKHLLQVGLRRANSVAGRHEARCLHLVAPLGKATAVRNER